MKKVISLLVALTMVLMAFVGCTPTASQAPGTSEGGGSTVAPPADAEPIDITILASSTSENVANIVRDLFIKAGFTVTLSIAPDTASSTAIRESGVWDVMYSGWNISGANPDYGTRSLFYTDAPFNRGGIADPEVDRLIDEGSAAIPELAWPIYEELEKVLLEDNAYYIPLFNNLKFQALNQTVLKPESAVLPKARVTGPWEMYEYVDASLSETRPLELTSTNSQVTSYWPPRHNDTISGYFTSNSFIRLMNLTPDDQLTTESALSRNYAVADGNAAFYFILRDDVTYAKVVDNAAVDTGIKVSASDVVYSLNIAKDKDAVPDHRTYTLFEKIDEVSIVTDLTELDGALTGGTGKLIDELSKGLPAPITALTDDINAVDNDAGVYQVVKITTQGAFPQIVYFLAHMASGIYNQESVEAVMADVDVANYDPTADIIYGDRTAMTQGPDYDNHMLFSGPYAVLYQDLNQTVLERNPGFMPETDRHAKIKTINVSFIQSPDSSISAFRSGDIDLTLTVPEHTHTQVKSDPNTHFTSIPSNSVGYLVINQHPEFNRVVMDEDVRKALMYSIDQNAFVAFFEGNKMPAYSTITPLFDSANEPIQADQNKVNEHLAAYWAKQG